MCVPIKFKSSLFRLHLGFPRCLTHFVYKRSPLQTFPPTHTLVTGILQAPGGLLLDFFTLGLKKVLPTLTTLGDGWDNTTQTALPAPAWLGRAEGAGAQPSCSTRGCYGSPGLGKVGKAQGMGHEESQGWWRESGTPPRAATMMMMTT